MQKKIINPVSEKLVLSHSRQIMAEVEKYNYLSLAGGLPDKELLKQFIPVVKEIIRKAPIKYMLNNLNYGKTQGDKDLLNKFAEIESERSGCSVRPDNILITTGSQQGIDVSFEAFAGNGIAVGIPTYLGIMTPLQKHAKKKVHPIAVDDEGMVIEELDDVLAKNPEIRASYVMTHGHNPAGVRLSLERRKRLVEIANKRDVLIITDDAYGGITSHFLKPVYSFNKGFGLVMHLSTISKHLYNARIGYIVAHPEHIRHLMPSIGGSTLHPSRLMQYITYNLICHVEKKFGSYRNYLSEMVEAHYSVKRERFGTYLSKHLGKYEGVSWHQPDEGFFYWVRFPEGTDTKELYEICKKKFGVVFVPGHIFDPSYNFMPKGYDSPIKNCIRVNFSMPTFMEMDHGLKMIAAAYDILLKKKKRVKEVFALQA